MACHWFGWCYSLSPLRGRVEKGAWVGRGGRERRYTVSVFSCVLLSEWTSRWEEDRWLPCGKESDCLGKRVGPPVVRVTCLGFKPCLVARGTSMFLRRRSGFSSTRDAHLKLTQCELVRSTECSGTENSLMTPACTAQSMGRQRALCGGCGWSPLGFGGVRFQMVSDAPQRPQQPSTSDTAATRLLEHSLVHTAQPLAVTSE